MAAPLSLPSRSAEWWEGGGAEVIGNQLLQLVGSAITKRLSPGLVGMLRSSTLVAYSLMFVLLDVLTMFLTPRKAMPTTLHIRSRWTVRGPLTFQADVQLACDNSPCPEANSTALEATTWRPE